jgi:hypothetical protein
MKRIPVHLRQFPATQALPPLSMPAPQGPKILRLPTLWTSGCIGGAGAHIKYG